MIRTLKHLALGRRSLLAVGAFVALAGALLPAMPVSAVGWIAPVDELAICKAKFADQQIDGVVALNGDPGQLYCFAYSIPGDFGITRIGTQLSIYDMKPYCIAHYGGNVRNISAAIRPGYAPLDAWWCTKPF